MNKSVHYEEAQDFDDVVDWDEVWGLPTFHKNRIIRSLLETATEQEEIEIRKCLKKNGKSKDSTEG